MNFINLELIQEFQILQLNSLIISNWIHIILYNVFIIYDYLSLKTN